MTSSELPTLVKRRLQAEVIGPIFAEMAAELGEVRAAAILDGAIRKAAIAEGKKFAAQAPGGVTSMRDFIKLYDLWTHDGALEIEILEASDKAFDFDVVRCRYAETYHAMGLGHIGHLMSCNRDGTFCQGYDPAIRMERQHTIMAGAKRCTFRYRYVQTA
ncbi:MAG: L-2-amino-thiazoline-4-carboxylic acid hydrolase [Phyllobacteriaceae bacterium]|nr:L-2-amino-thiazoline-4-carboxylic acid hydrolase [Phyllobacteriaceae bacterium]